MSRRSDHKLLPYCAASTMRALLRACGVAGGRRTRLVVKTRVSQTEHVACSVTCICCLPGCCRVVADVAVGRLPRRPSTLHTVCSALLCSRCGQRTATVRTDAALRHIVHALVQSTRSWRAHTSLRTLLQSSAGWLAALSHAHHSTPHHSRSINAPASLCSHAGGAAFIVLHTLPLIHPALPTPTTHDRPTL